MSTALAAVSSALGRSLSFSVPLADLAEFSALAEKRRIEVQLTLRLLARVHEQLGARSLQGACMTVAASSKHLMRGCAAPSLRRKYEALRDSVEDAFPEGNWRVLVAGYCGPSKQPKEFVQELKRVAELNHRSIKEAFRQLRERWAAGEMIPGQGITQKDGTTPPGNWMELYERLYPLRPLPKTWPRGFYPTGWSLRNLLRYGPSKGGRMLFQRGMAAAKKHFPSVTRDPSQLRRFELLVMDDFELNCNCVFPGDQENKPQIGRVAGLLMKSVATRENLHWVLGQRLLRLEPQADGSTKEVKAGIARIDVQIFLCGFFAKYGLPDYQVTILCEEDKTAASISRELELSIEILFGGRVKIERTGILKYRGLKNGFCERGGRPWIKGWIESTFNHLWNVLGAQKGYKGSLERLNAPADLKAKLAYTKVLIGHGEGELNLPPDKIAELRTPFPSIAECEAAFAWAATLSNTRTDHEYIGFGRVTEFLLEEGGEPQPFAHLALLSAAQQTQVKVVERMESSLERAERLAATETYTPVDRAVLSVFLLKPMKLVYKNHAISFRLKNGPGASNVGFSYIDRDGTVLRDVQEGTEFLCYFNPQAPEQLHITQPNGSRTGTLYRFGGKRGAVNILDQAALDEAAAIQATLINRTTAENRARHAGEDARLGDDLAHNAAIVARHQAETAGLTVGQKIGLAAGESAQRAHEQRKRDAQAARGVPAQSGSKGLADLVQAPDAAEPAVAHQAPETPAGEAADEGSIDVNDL